MSYAVEPDEDGQGWWVEDPKGNPMKHYARADHAQRLAGLLNELDREIDAGAPSPERTSPKYQVKLSSNGFPRRNRIDLATPAETAIRAAIWEVEKAGGHPRLTDAVIRLGEAQEAVADFVDLTWEDPHRVVGALPSGEDD